MFLAAYPLKLLQGKIESVLLIEKPADAKNEIWNVKPSGASKVSSKVNRLSDVST